MTDLQVRRVISQLVTAKVFKITITGGEPLLYPKKVAQVIAACSENGIDCSVNTNLTAATKKTVAMLRDAGRFTVLTSIASFDPDLHDELMGRVGAFRKTMSGITVLREYRVPFGVSMVLSQANANHVYETGLLAKKLGAKSFAATKASAPMGCPDYSSIRPSSEQIRHSLDALLELREVEGINTDILECYPLCFFGDISKYQVFARRNCSAAIVSATVGSSGEVRPCSHSSRNYGNVFADNLTDIYSRMSEWRTGELLPRKCLACEHLKRCSGGCRCEAEYDGDIAGMDTIATGPEAVHGIPCNTPSAATFRDDLPFYISEGVKTRTEAFGAIVRRGSNTVFLDEDGLSLIQQVAATPTTTEDMISILKCDPAELQRLLGRLLHDGIVNQKGKEVVKDAHALNVQRL